MKKRKLYFRFVKKVVRIKYKRPTFMFLGEEYKNGSIIICNHEGTDTPMTLEIFCKSPLRMWGAWEMNSGLIKMYKYQSRVYYHEKKHWNLFLARLFCLLASPLTNMFYSGLNLISTYRDNRFIKTIKESIRALENGENVVIYPEDSTNGYLPELEGFYHGFLALAKAAYKKGIDVPIYVTYFQKNKRIFVVDKPILYSELSKDNITMDDMANKLLARCNELGKMTFTKEKLDKKHLDYYGFPRKEFKEKKAA